MSNTSLQSATRRFIFGRVNEALFEAYREFDPALSRIIRNLKRWIRASEKLYLERINGTLWVRHSQASDARHRPLAPEEYIESHLIPAVAGEESHDAVITTLETLLSYGDVYREAYPVTTLARILKSCHKRLREPKVAHAPTAVSRLALGETHRLVLESVSHVERGMYETYVENGKVDPTQYAMYFRAIHARLEAEYVEFDGRDATNYKALNGQMPTLSREEYRCSHRPVFEYLSKLTRQRLIQTLQEVYTTSTAA